MPELCFLEGQTTHTDTQNIDKEHRQSKRRAGGIVHNCVTQVHRVGECVTVSEKSVGSESEVQRDSPVVVQILLGRTSDLLVLSCCPF